MFHDRKVAFVVEAIQESIVQIDDICTSGAPFMLIMIFFSDYISRSEYYKVIITHSKCEYVLTSFMGLDNLEGKWP